MGAAVCATLAASAVCGAAAEDRPAPKLVLEGHGADLAGAAFSPDGTKTASAS
jgi:hypothetical protein